MPNLHVKFSAWLFRLPVPDISRRVGEGDGPSERAGDGQGADKSASGECGGVAVFGYGGEVVFLGRDNEMRIGRGHYGG